ncbi:MAG: acyltransferase, partial [Chloroflexi bacterium]|nr:acyltransferase [Chloroflexota bacterium]
KDQATVGWRVVAARLGTLIPPYLLWSTAALALRYLEGRRYGVAGVLKAYLTGSTNEVLYFIPLLIQFYLLSPLLIPLARNHWKVLIAIAGGLQLALLFCQYPLYLGWDWPLAGQILRWTPKWLFLSRPLWFPLGMVVAFHLGSFKEKFAFVRKWALPAAAVCLAVGVAEWELYFRLSGADWLATRETLLDSIFALVVIFGVLLADAAKLPWVERLASLGTRSYGIYLIHALVMEYAARAVYRFAPALLGYQIFLQPFLIVLGLGIPLAMMAFTDRTPLRRFYKLIYG